MPEVMFGLLCLELLRVDLLAQYQDSSPGSESVSKTRFAALPLNDP
jgi:hypothetical protein